MFDMDDPKVAKWVKTFFILFIIFLLLMIAVFSATAFVQLSLNPSDWNVSTRGGAVGIIVFIYLFLVLIIIASRHG